MDYIELLKQRAKESKIYTPHQMTGLLLADILEDAEHKSLYMRLAKNNDNDALMKLAKDVADRKSIKNKGAYFMKLWQKENAKRKTTQKSRQNAALWQ